MSTLLLIAQAGPPELPQSLMVVLLSAGVGAILLTIVVMTLKSAMKERELEHAERLKAIEKGILLDDVEEERRFRKGIMRLSFGIGVFLPAIAVIAAATGAANMPGPVSSLTVFLIWTGAAAVGVAGVGGGAWLANAAITRLKPSRSSMGQDTSPYPHSYQPAEPIVNR